MSLPSCPRHEATGRVGSCRECAKAADRYRYYKNLDKTRKRNNDYAAMKRDELASSRLNAQVIGDLVKAWRWPVEPGSLVARL